MPFVELVEEALSPLGDLPSSGFPRAKLRQTTDERAAGATEARGANGNVKLTIPGITNGAVDTGSNGYLAGNGSRTATFAGTVALQNSGSATTVTITVTSLTGDQTATSSGMLAFAPATTITGTDGSPVDRHVHGVVLPPVLSSAVDAGAADIAAFVVHIMSSTAITGAMYGIGGGRSSSCDQPRSRPWNSSSDLTSLFRMRPRSRR